MDDLKTRAKQFLDRPYPLGRKVEDNLSDGFIHRYLEGGPWDDPELLELLRICLACAQGEADIHQREGRAYFQECAEVLQGIMSEVYKERNLQS